MNRREGIRRTVVWAGVALFGAVGAGLLLLELGGAVTGGDAWWLLLGWTGFPVVGAMILTSRPGNMVGRLLLLVGLWWAFAGLVLFAATDEGLPAAVLTIAYGAVNLAFLVLPVLVLVFPTGRIHTRFGWVVLWAVVGVGVVLYAAALLHAGPTDSAVPPSPWGVPELLPVTRVILGEAGFLGVPVLLAGALVDLVIRWRQSTGAERLQFRWFAYGVTITIVIFTLGQLGGDELDGWSGLAVIINAIPVCIGIAVTRHGLYEIGRVVSRTVSYAIVTALVVAVYALVVTLASRLAPDQSTLAVAAATLAAAGVFLPVLRRVQRVIDRRFDRERYDAAQVVDAFGEKLRTSVDPEHTAADLVAAVERTLQPSAVGIWTDGAAR